VPIYEYECQTCHHRVELIQKVNDAPLAECPKCHGEVTKLIAPSALQFKGSGWYITDYSAKGKGKADDAPADKKGSESKPSTPPAATTSATGKKSEGGGGGSSAPSPKSEGNAAS